MSEEKREPGRRLQSVVIRSPSKIVFLYPTFLAALIAGLWSAIDLGGGKPLQDLALGPGRLFWWVFSINLLVLAFDFSRGEFFALILSFFVVVMGIFILNQEWEVVRPVQEVLSHIRLQAHPHFYFLTALTLGMTFVAVFLYSRFDYWEITHNELLHHHGLLGDVERYPAPDLRMTKEITDIFEYALLGAGRLVIQPRGAARATVLENVPFVNRKEEHIKHMLSSLSVTVDTRPAPEAGGED